MIQLLNGDCLSLLSEIPDGSINMVLTDLPYGTTKNKWDTVIDLESLWRQYKRITTPNAAIVLFGDGMFTATLMTNNVVAIF